MCMAIPARVMTLNSDVARVETDLQQLDVGRRLVPELDVGDWVLVNTGQIVTRLTPEEAAETYQLLRELQELVIKQDENPPG